MCALCAQFFSVCFYLRQTERAYEKCAVGLTHGVSVPKKLKILLFKNGGALNKVLR